MAQHESPGWEKLTARRARRQQRSRQKKFQEFDQIVVADAKS